MGGRGATTTMKTARTSNSLTMPKGTDARCAGWQGRHWRRQHETAASAGEILTLVDAIGGELDAMMMNGGRRWSRPVANVIHGWLSSPRGLGPEAVLLSAPWASPQARRRLDEIAARQSTSTKLTIAEALAELVTDELRWLAPRSGRT